MRGVGRGLGVGVALDAWVFKRTDVDAAVHHAIDSPGRAGQEKGGGVKLGSPALIAGLAGNNACVKARAAVILQRTEHWIGVNLIAGAG